MKISIFKVIKQKLSKEGQLSIPDSVRAKYTEIFNKFSIFY